MRRAPEPPKGDKPEKVIEYRVINGVFRGTLKISERRMTNDECPRLTYSAIADNPEGGLAGKGGECEPHG